MKILANINDCKPKLCLQAVDNGAVSRQIKSKATATDFCIVPD